MWCYWRNGFHYLKYYFELQYLKSYIMCICMHVKSCLTLSNLMDCSLLGSSVSEIFQTRIMGWVAISYSRGIFLTQGSNQHLSSLLHRQADSLLLHHNIKTQIIRNYNMMISVQNGMKSLKISKAGKVKECL